jgi:hypothetical protein
MKIISTGLWLELKFKYCKQNCSVCLRRGNKWFGRLGGKAPEMRARWDKRPKRNGGKGEQDVFSSCFARFLGVSIFLCHFESSLELLSAGALQ